MIISYVKELVNLLKFTTCKMLYSIKIDKLYYTRLIHINLQGYPILSKYNKFISKNP